ncbi:lysophospholipid acyltransferase family protein [Methyloversatilis thermotolerans]|uniref:lysophospholipid acyltransferase family protein n=1 Tax=Methyloversatilis thermotolerans TaxID=1346290 RepID=UPI00036BB01D|nr:lysophospholipid acyltransferase family protein [Methyloversatilis thermotolerans]
MLISALLIGLTRALVGAAPRWMGSVPTAAQRIYFANHSSHIDTLALWSALPRALRRRTRPVAAADYWNADPVRRCIAVRGLNAVFIERQRSEATKDPLAPLAEALDAGDSLILFPEGTRNLQALPAPFKAGLFHLAERFPDVELVPVYLENLHRCMPKGSVFPVPLICTVRFGAPLARIAGETRADFLERARRAVTELA